MGIIEIILLTIFGFAVGLPASLAGLGGGFLIMPVLIFFFGLPAQNAVAVSLAAMCGTTISASLVYLKQKKVDFFLALLYDVFDVPGVIVGAYLASLITSDLLTGLVGVFIISLSVLLMIRKDDGPVAPKNSTAKRSNQNKGWIRKKIDSDGKTFWYNIKRPFMIFLSSFTGGLVTGFAGLGGGITDTSTMILLGVPSHIAVASSELAMALTNGAGLLTHGFLDNLLIEYAIPLTFGTIVGAQVGAFLSKYVKGAIIRKVLIVLALIAGIRLVTFAFNFP
jgi:uncharacterized membrane protein YfcA